MRSQIAIFWLLGPLTSVLATDILITSGFTNCLNGANTEITAKNLNIQFDRQASQVTFDVAGYSPKAQNVTASLSVTAYGKPVYSKDFDPCDPSTKIDQLCPVPKGQFTAQGVHDVPASFASQIPGIAFSIPDLECEATLDLKATDSGEDLACIQSDIENGRTMRLPAISYLAIAITGAALFLTGGFVLSNGDATSARAPSPNFGACLLWFQSVTTNGMLSVNYPPVYRSFTRNFAFSAGLIPWTPMQNSIDQFRAKTGGDPSDDSAQDSTNSTSVFSNSSNGSIPTLKRGLDLAFSPFEPMLVERDILNTANDTQGGSSTTSSNSTNSAGSKTTQVAMGIHGFVEQLTIPQANTFMTVFLFFLIAIAAIAVGIFIFKIAIEAWAIRNSVSKKLASFQNRYWGLLGRSITNLILIMYGVWTLYCIFQFTNGDSWAAKTIAIISWAAFTAVLGFFTFRIWHLVKRHKKLDGGPSVLFEDKEAWRRYSLFYDGYKQGFWWVFMPSIIYVFARGCVIAAGNGHGLAQAGGQLIVESAMMTLVLVTRPFSSIQSNVINISIHIFRVLSVVCILIFAEEMNVAQSTKTITAVVLIVVQSVFTVILGIIIAVNAIITCLRPNPRSKEDKEAEKLDLDTDSPTLSGHINSAGPTEKGHTKEGTTISYPTAIVYRDKISSKKRGHTREESDSERLAHNAAPIAGYGHRRNTSQESDYREASEKELGPYIDHESW